MEAVCRSLLRIGKAFDDLCGSKLLATLDRSSR